MEFKNWTNGFRVYTIIIVDKIFVFIATDLQVH